MKNCIRCGTEVKDATLCEDCQDHEDAQEHWHNEFLDHLVYDEEESE